MTKAYRKPLKMSPSRIELKAKRGQVKKSHTSLAIGYQPKGKGRVCAYQGRFGKGYVIYSHSSKSTQYMDCAYYIKNK